MSNLRLCNAAIIQYSQLKFAHIYLCGMDYKYFSPHCCKCNSFGCTAAIRCGNAYHGPHSDSVYSGSKHNQFDSPRLVKRETGFPNPQGALIDSNQLWRCGVSVVACGTVGCLCDNPRGAGGYQIVTMTTLFPVFNKCSTSLRRNCCRFGGVFVAGCTGNCHAGNFHCGRLREFRRNGVFTGFSFLGITSELFDEFAYWFLNYQPSFYYCTAILLSILFHPILFPCISFQILFLWILFLMWAIYIDIIVFIIFFNVLLHVCFMYHYFVPLFICIFISIYLLKVGD